MKNVIASAGMLALGAVVAQSVRADMAAAPEKPWTISGTLRGFYDDNYNTEPNGPAKKSSFGFEVRPQATYGYASGPTTFTASYTYSERYFAQRPGNKSDQSHDLELSLQHAFNERYSAALQESFVVSQEPEILDSSVSFPLRANGDNIRNYASLNLDAEVTPLLGFVVGYANTFYDYMGDTFSPQGVSYGNLLNRIEQYVTLNSRWHFTEDTTGIFGYQFGAINYTKGGEIIPTSPTTPPDSRNNFSHFIYVGVEHSFRSDLTASARGGVQISDYYNLNKSSLNNPSSTDLGPFAELSATYSYMESGKLTVGFRQSRNQTDVANIGPSLVVDQESSSLYGQIDQTLTPISPRLVAHLQAQYQNSSFEGAGISDNDVFYLVGLNFTYQFNRFVSAEVGYNYDLLVSDLPNRGYDRNRVYLGVTATY